MPDTALIPYAATQDETLIDTWLRTKRSIHTQHAYERDIQDYADHLRDEKHYEPSTQARMLAAVKSLCTFAMDTGAISFNVGKAQLLPEGKDKFAQRILSKAQVDRMLYEAEKAVPRNHLILLLLYGSGIRC